MSLEDEHALGMHRAQLHVGCPACIEEMRKTKDEIKKEEIEERLDRRLLQQRQYRERKHREEPADCGHYVPTFGCKVCIHKFKRKERTRAEAMQTGGYF